MLQPLLLALPTRKGYTEVFTDSDGQRHGLGLGKFLAAKSDANKVRYQGRQTLAALADKHLVKGHGRQYERIIKHNTGKQKIVRQNAQHRAVVRTKVFTAAHALVDKATVLVIEDLSRPIVKHDRGRHRKRRLSGWVKGLIQEAVTAISRRRGASVDCVNAAYTSQVVRCHPVLGGVMAESFTARYVGQCTMWMQSRRKTSSTEGPIWKSAASRTSNACERSSRPGSAMRHREMGKHRQVRYLSRQDARLRLPSLDSSWNGMRPAVNGERNSMRRSGTFWDISCSSNQLRTVC